MKCSFRMEPYLIFKYLNNVHIKETITISKNFELDIYYIFSKYGNNEFKPTIISYLKYIPSFNLYWCNIINDINQSVFTLGSLLWQI